MCCLLHRNIPMCLAKLVVLGFAIASLDSGAAIWCAATPLWHYTMHVLALAGLASFQCRWLLLVIGFIIEFVWLGCLWTCLPYVAQERLPAVLAATT